jgi:hypothetical protein
MISEKYLAGFLDSDGCIGLDWRHLDRAQSNPEIQRGYLNISFSQETKQDKVLYLIKDAYGGNINFYKAYTILKIMGSPAIQILNRIKQHLVIKRHYAEYMLTLTNLAHNRKEVSSAMKRQRRVESSALPNFPSRKWMAGYLDGDGSFTARLPKGRTATQPTLEVVASNYDVEGISLMQKVFGGSIQNVTGKPVKQWVLTLPPSKMQQIWEYCGDHLITKKEQAQFLYGCSKMGHYHDGKRIKEFVTQLKAHPHRLNEPGSNVVALLQQVVDIKTNRETMRKRWSDNDGKCECGSKIYYSNNLCRKCYDKKR